MRYLSLGRFAFIGLAVAFFLILMTAWVGRDSFGETWSIPLYAPREQRPCPALPNSDSTSSPLLTTDRNSSSITPSTSKLHYLIPSTHSKDGVCAGIASALLNRYPPPVMIGWKAEGKYNAKSHIGKLHSISRYLHGIDNGRDDDLVIVVDAFDIIAQIPAEATIQLYFDMMRAANERLAARHGITVDEARAQDLYQSLLWGAEKGCFPPMFHEAQCWLVPDSDAPHNQWGPKWTTGEAAWRFPKALNSGAVIGPVGDLRAFIDATLVLIEETFDPDFQYRNSDQLYLARLYARQEYHRNIGLVPEKEPYPGLNDDKRRTLPEPSVNDTDVTEYHVTVDFEYAFAQHHCYNERFMRKLKYDNWDKTTTIKKDWLDEGDGFSEYNIQMPGYIHKALTRIWHSIDEEEKPTSTALDWVRNLRMNTNVATQKIFAFYHSTCVKKNFIERFQDYWFFPDIDKLLKAAAKETRKGVPISGQKVSGRVWLAPKEVPDLSGTGRDVEGYGGVFTDHGEELYLTYNEICGDDMKYVLKLDEKKEEKPVDEKPKEEELVKDEEKVDDDEDEGDAIV